MSNLETLLNNMPDGYYWLLKSQPQEQKFFHYFFHLMPLDTQAVVNLGFVSIETGQVCKTFRGFGTTPEEAIGFAIRDYSLWKAGR